MHQLDTRHLRANQRKYIKASNKATTIMPGKTKAYRQYTQNRFALDMSKRCQAELHYIIKKKSKNILDNTRVMMSNIRQCFAGSIQQCAKWKRIEYRIGDETVQLTRLNTNTQKVEGTNRAIKPSLPKDKTFSRNFQSRAHSALHFVNNGPEKFLAQTLFCWRMCNSFRK